MAGKLFEVIAALDERGLSFSIQRNSSESLTLVVTDVGKRIEIYVHQDGAIDFSVFRGPEDVIVGFDALRRELDGD